MFVCEICGRQEVRVRLGSEQMCLDCYNGRMTEELGVAATSYPRRVSLEDGTGKVHNFRLRKRLDPSGIIMEAEEEKLHGYAFQVSGKLHDNQEQLLLELIAKAERGMAERSITHATFLGETHNLLRNDRLVGSIEWDPAAEEVPLLIIDGKPYTWEQVGKMLMTYEGAQVKMEMIDPSDEVE